MPGSFQENDSADDSRTAHVGSRNKNKFNGASRQSLANDPSKRGPSLKNNKSPPQGTNSNRGTSQSTESSGSKSSEGESILATQRTGKMKPAINWNTRGKGAIRTSLRGSSTTNAPESASFQAINGKYWRSRSGSASSAGNEEHEPTEPGEVLEYISNNKSGDVTHQAQSPMVISSDSDLEDVSGGDDDIVLNLRPEKPTTAFQSSNTVNDVYANNVEPQETNHVNGNYIGEVNEAIPAQRFAVEVHSKSQDTGSQAQVNGAKATTFRSFTSKYSSPPQTLADLSRDDLEVQVKYMFYHVPAENVDLHSPVRCTECMKEGHLSSVCPDKECEHCGEWDSHDSQFCPTWRRCQKCRERGHVKEDCSSPLKRLPSEVPCDLCNSPEHIESDCDMLWKIPKRDINLGRLFVCVCCSFCTSKQHLLGDCPLRPFPMNSSSWSLTSYDQTTLAELTSSAPAGARYGTREDLPNLRSRVGRHEEIHSDESDGPLVGNNFVAINKNTPRSHIRFGNGIGRGRSLGPNPPREADNTQDYRGNYRDRDQFFGRNTRQRSLSPDPYPPRRGGGANRYMPPRSPPLDYDRPHPPSRGRARSRRGGPPPGRGKNGKPPPGKEVYRPLPSSAKRARDKHRM